MFAHEKHRRSLVKSITYRLLSVTVDLLVAYFFTKNFTLSLGIVLIVDGYSTLLYYLHERVWSHIGWGRAPKIDSAQNKTAPMTLERLQQLHTRAE
jgi:uncharacterized membrane protein